MALAGFNRQWSYTIRRRIIRLRKSRVIENTVLLIFRSTLVRKRPDKRANNVRPVM